MTFMKFIYHGKKIKEKGFFSIDPSGNLKSKTMVSHQEIYYPKKATI